MKGVVEMLRDEPWLDWDALWEVYACQGPLSDPTVATVLHEAQEWAEIDLLRRQKRLPVY